MQGMQPLLYSEVNRIQIIAKLSFEKTVVVQEKKNKQKEKQTNKHYPPVWYSVYNYYSTIQ